MKIIDSNAFRQTIRESFAPFIPNEKKRINLEKGIFNYIIHEAKDKRIVITIIVVISPEETLFNISFFVITRANPKTKSIFAIFDPTTLPKAIFGELFITCLLYTSDAADE